MFYLKLAKFVILIGLTGEILAQDLSRDNSCNAVLDQIVNVTKKIDFKDETEIIRVFKNLENIKALESLTKEYLNSGNSLQKLIDNVTVEVVNSKAGERASLYRRLSIATESGSINWIKEELKNNNTKDELEGYLFSDDKKVVKLLLACGANPNIYNAEGMTPLHMAVNDLDLKTTRMLLYRKANPNAKIKIGELTWGDKSKVTPLLLILNKLKELLDTKSEISERIMDIYTKVIEALLINGADVKLKNPEGQSALAIAKDILRIIRFNNFQLQQQYKNCPPLISSKNQKAIENIISMLIKYGARK